VYLKNKPAGYSFLPEFAACSCKQISIETAEPKLDCSVLTKLPGKKIMVGCIDLSDEKVESPQTVAARVKRALEFIPPQSVILAPDCGMKFLPRESAFGKLQAMAEAARMLRKEYT
jgi:5-methyltetrahydropteroyltriglutamate--homocysteine methyltransferase